MFFRRSATFSGVLIEAVYDERCELLLSFVKRRRLSALAPRVTQEGRCEI